MSRERVTIDNHTLSGIIDMLIEHAYDEDGKEFYDVHDLSSYVNGLEGIKVQIVKYSNFTHFGFIEEEI